MLQMINIRETILHVLQYVEWENTSWYGHLSKHWHGCRELFVMSSTSHVPSSDGTSMIQIPGDLQRFLIF